MPPPSNKIRSQAANASLVEPSGSSNAAATAAKSTPAPGAAMPIARPPRCAGPPSQNGNVDRGGDGLTLKGGIQRSTATNFRPPANAPGRIKKHNREENTAMRNVRPVTGEETTRRPGGAVGSGPASGTGRPARPPKTCESFQKTSRNFKTFCRNLFEILEMLKN